MRNLKTLLDRAERAGQDPEKVLAQVLEASASVPISSDEYAGNMLKMLDLFGAWPPAPEPGRAEEDNKPWLYPLSLPPGILTCQWDFDDFAAYLQEVNLRDLNIKEFTALRQLMDDLACFGDGWIPERYRQRQKSEYDRLETDLTERVIAAGYVLMDDFDGYSVHLNYHSPEPLVSFCRQFVALASPAQITEALISIDPR